MFKADAFQFEDIFKPESEVKRNELVEAVRKTSAQAKRCLNSEEFQSYKNSFDQTQAKLIDAMIVYTHEFFSDPKVGMDVYGANMARMITKLGDLRVLLAQVESDAKKADRLMQQTEPV